MPGLEPTDSMQNTSIPVTLQDIARVINVSTMTVSLALRNSPRVSQTRRREIQKLAHKMGYQLNIAARSLSTRPRRKAVSARASVTQTIAWINNWQNPRNLFTHKKYNLYWKGASAAAHHFGIHLQEFIVPHHSSFSKLEESLREQNIQTLLIPPHECACALDWSQFCWAGFSIVKIGHSLSQIPGNSVADNEFANSRLALHEISRKGYARIGFVSHELPGLFEAGILVSPSPSQSRIPVLHLLSDDPQKNLNDLFLWIQEHRPDAILSNIPDIKRMLLLLEHRIPEEIGLAVIHESTDTSLAGVFPHSEEIGWAAVETLLHGMANKGAFPIPKQILINGQWIDGRSLPDKNQYSSPKLQAC